MTWTNVADDEAARSWDQKLAGWTGHHLVQSFGWGNYQATRGWTPLRWVARDPDRRTVAMAQTLVRVYPCRTVIVWCPGGLAGPIDYWNPELLERIAESTRAQRCYCRVAFTRERTSDAVAYLRARGWTQPRRAVSAPLTMVWELAATEQQLRAGLRPNWRHNLNRALKRNLRVVRWTAPSPAAIAGLFETMAAYKKVPDYFDVPALNALLRTLTSRVHTYACEDDSGTPLAVRACVVQNESAWDLLAATSPEGRRCYAAYAVFWALLRHCRALGVTTYDLGGIDPVSTPGVYDFKRGTGAREQECLGEWEWTTSPLLTRAINLVVRNRSHGAFP